MIAHSYPGMPIIYAQIGPKCTISSISRIWFIRFWWNFQGMFLVWKEWRLMSMVKWLPILARACPSYQKSSFLVSIGLKKVFFKFFLFIYFWIFFWIFFCIYLFFMFWIFFFFWIFFEIFLNFFLNFFWISIFFLNFIYLFIYFYLFRYLFIYLLLFTKILAGVQWVLLVGFTLEVIDQWGFFLKWYSLQWNMV